MEVCSQFEHKVGQLVTNTKREHGYFLLLMVFQIHLFPEYTLFLSFL